MRITFDDQVKTALLRTVVKFRTHFLYKTSKEIDTSTLVVLGLRSRKMGATDFPRIYFNRIQGHKSQKRAFSE